MTSYSTLLHFPQVHISLHQLMSGKENQKFHEKKQQQKNKKKNSCLVFKNLKISLSVPEGLYRSNVTRQVARKNYTTQKSSFGPVGLVRRSIYHVPHHQKGCLDVTSYPSPVNQSEMKHNAEHKP